MMGMQIKVLLIVVAILISGSIQLASADDVFARANAGEANAQYEMGRRLERGEGLPQSDIKALNWFKLAAEQGHAVAQFNLGWMYANGYGGSRDDIQAFYWFSQAADQNIEDAVGQLTALGRSMSADDLAKARQMSGQEDTYQEAAAQLDLPADKHLAFLELRIRYNHGDAENALSGLGQMALAGDMNAQNLLGFHLMNASDEISQQEAFKWLVKAARQGHAAARYNLAVCYIKGVGTSFDAGKAIRWLDLAEEAVSPTQDHDYQATIKLFQEKTEYADPYIAAAQGYQSAERELLELIKYRREESFARLQLQGN